MRCSPATILTAFSTKTKSETGYIKYAAKHAVGRGVLTVFLPLVSPAGPNSKKKKKRRDKEIEGRRSCS
jgi:hypothetical protein